MYVQIYDAGQYFTMTPLEGDKMKVVVSFVAGLSKDDSSKLDVCPSVSLSIIVCLVMHGVFLSTFVFHSVIVFTVYL